MSGGFAFVLWIVCVGLLCMVQAGPAPSKQDMKLARRYIPRDGQGRTLPKYARWTSTPEGHPVPVDPIIPWWDWDARAAAGDPSVWQ